MTLDVFVKVFNNKKSIDVCMYIMDNACHLVLEQGLYVHIINKDAHTSLHAYAHTV